MSTLQEMKDVYCGHKKIQSLQTEKVAGWRETQHTETESNSPVSVVLVDVHVDSLVRGTVTRALHARTRFQAGMVAAMERWRLEISWKVLRQHVSARQALCSRP